MDPKEIAQEMLNFLSETGNYQAFLSYMEAKGFDPDELERDIETQIESD